MTVKHFHRVFDWNTEETSVDVEVFTFTTELAADMFIHAMQGKFAETIRLTKEA